MTIKISPTVTEEQRRDPRFIELLKQSEAFFSSSHFTANERRSLALHEAGHIIYAKLAGVKGEDIKYFGPEMFWDYRPALGYDCPCISKCSIEWALPEGTNPKDAVKACIASFVIREALDKPNDEVAISLDMDRAHGEYLRFGGVRNDFDKMVEKAREEILADLQHLEFVSRINQTATEFTDAVFPLPRSAKRHTVPVVGRNDRCSCGSGRKFKKCCGWA